MPTAEELIRAARVYLARPGTLTAPNPASVLTPALWTLTLRGDPACPTMGVSEDWVLYYNPNRVATWPVKAIATVLLHEVWHLLRDHHARAKQQGVMNGLVQAWNIATDAEINDGLVEAKYVFPPGVQPVTSDVLNLPKHLLAEEYYARLPKSPQMKSQGNGQGQEQQGDFGGSCADGIQRPWEKGSGSNTGDKDGKGKPQGQSTRVIPEELIRRQIAENIAQEAPRSRGTIPGNWEAWAKMQIAPRVIPWQQVLRQVVGTIVAAGKKDEYTYARINRRESLSPTFVMPGSYGTLPELVCCVDTSGSMWNDLDECVEIVESALEFLGKIQPITVLTGDTCVQATSKVLDARKIVMQGGGGTDMRELIDAAVRLRPRPQVIVVITDGYTSWPEHEPAGCQLVAVVITDEEIPQWITTVRVNKT